MSSNGEVLRRYGAASEVDDFATMGALKHPDWQLELPQSGEVFVGHDNYVAMRTSRPEGLPRLKGLRMDGEGDHWWGEDIITYGDGSRWLVVSIVTFKGGLIWRERSYFMQPFPAQPARAQWVTRVEPAL
ncbi:MAG: nuclear transport factor 2 family protein [Bauldia sp.]|nr:nuclear transport factor 2 family protein [Bauldia sp.]